jgi:putative YphP/YqiW family bacilliredoxin
VTGKPDDATGKSFLHYLCLQIRKTNPMYPEQIVTPMRAELVSAGFQELRTAGDVDQALSQSEGTTLVVVNSVCGCAAGSARPGVKMAVEHASKKPAHLTTVFAGNDAEATAQARKYFAPYPPSSPAMALFKDGKLVHFIERHHIEGRTPQMISENLMMAFEQYC